MSTPPNKGHTGPLSIQGVALKGWKGPPVRGTVLKWEMPISFLGDVDPATGNLSREGRTSNVKDKVLVFPEGAGSTVGSYVIYNLKLNGNAPRAMLMRKAEAIIAMGCIIANIPLVHRLSDESFGSLRTGDTAEVDPTSGRITIWKGDEVRR